MNAFCFIISQLKNWIDESSAIKPDAVRNFFSPYPQLFPFPTPIMRYIRSSPEAWKKLIKTCKYFYSKNPVFPISSVFIFQNSICKADREIFNPKQALPKFWCYDEIHIYAEECPNILSSIIPKISKLDVKYFYISDQNLTFDEYSFLTSSDALKHFHYYSNMYVKYSDGTMVTCDKLLEKLKLARKIEMNCMNNTAYFDLDTSKKIAEMLPTFKKLQFFELYKLPNSFDISPFIDFISKNSIIDVQFYYANNAQLSDAHKINLEESIAKIIASHPKRFPMIYYSGFNGARYLEYQDLRDKSLRF